MGDVVTFDLTDKDFGGALTPFDFTHRVKNVIEECVPDRARYMDLASMEVEVFPPEDMLSYTSTWQQCFFKECHKDNGFLWTVVHAEFFKHVSTTPQILRLFFEPKGPLERLVYG